MHPYLPDRRAGGIYLLIRRLYPGSKPCRRYQMARAYDLGVFGAGRRVHVRQGVPFTDEILRPFYQDGSDASLFWTWMMP